VFLIFCAAVILVMKYQNADIINVFDKYARFCSVILQNLRNLKDWRILICGITV
jgi:hypothetical protein